MEVGKYLLEYLGPFVLWCRQARHMVLRQERNQVVVEQNSHPVVSRQRQHQLLYT